ncbi:unnamed protein product, partial [Prorocentrum cordatum]
HGHSTRCLRRGGGRRGHALVRLLLRQDSRPTTRPRASWAGGSRAASSRPRPWPGRPAARRGTATTAASSRPTRYTESHRHLEQECRQARRHPGQRPGRAAAAVRPPEDRRGGRRVGPAGGAPPEPGGPRPHPNDMEIHFYMDEWSAAAQCQHAEELSRKVGVVEELARVFAVAGTTLQATLEKQARAAADPAGPRRGSELDPSAGFPPKCVISSTGWNLNIRHVLPELCQPPAPPRVGPLPAEAGVAGMEFLAAGRRHRCQPARACGRRGSQRACAAK